MSIFKESEKYSSKEIETVIGSSVKVEGNFIGEGNVVVEGEVHGTLKTNHNLTIGKNAKVKADVEASNLFISGEIKGNVKIHEKTEMSNTAKILGNLETKSLSMETGAILNGKCIMVQTVNQQPAKKED